MNTVHFMPPCNNVLRYLVKDIEPADAEELLAANNGGNLFDILHDSVRHSFHCYVPVINDEPIGIFGCAAMDDQGLIGVPWAVFTTVARKYPRELLTFGKKYRLEFGEMFSELTNMVDSQNTRAIRWLEKIGYVMHEDMTLPSGAVFKRFTNHV